MVIGSAIAGVVALLVLLAFGCARVAGRADDMTERFMAELGLTDD